MRERHFYFVVVLILFFNVENFSQIKPTCIKLPINYNTLANFEFEKQLQWHVLPKDSTFILKKIKCDSAIIKKQESLFVLSPSYYSNHFSYFCNKELNL